MSLVVSPGSHMVENTAAVMTTVCLFSCIRCSTNGPPMGPWSSLSDEADVLRFVDAKCTTVHLVTVELVDGSRAPSSISTKPKPRERRSRDRG